MKNRKSVVFFHAYPHQVAGAQVMTAHLANDVRSSGWDTHVIVPGEGPFVQYLRDRHVDVSIVQAGSSLLLFGRKRGASVFFRRATAILVLWWRLWLRFRALGAVVHVNDHRGVILAGVPARLAGRPVVWHAHGPLQSRFLNRACAAVATRVVAVSSDTLKALSLSRRTTLAKANVIHNCLIASPTSPPEDDQPLGRPLIAVGARLHPDKGLDVLFAATALLRVKYPGMSVAVAGHVQRGYEAYAEHLKALCVELGIQDCVYFLGRVEKTAALWEVADVYVQPSRAEPFGLCLLEAMAAGTPVVACNIGGMREVVEDGVNGLLCNPEDPVDLAAAVQRVIETPDLAAGYVNEGFTALQTKFSPDRLNRQFISLYESMAGAGHRRVIRVGNAVTLWTIQRSQLIELRNSGVDVVCLTDADEWSARLEGLGIVTVAADLPRRPTPLAVLRWTISVMHLLPVRQRVILHSHNAAHILGIRILSLVIRRHCVVETFHNTYEMFQPGKGRTVVRAALRTTRSRCAKALFISERYEELALDHRLVPLGRTEVIGTGIAVTAFQRRVFAARPRAVVRADLGVAGDDVLAIVVARLDPQKGHQLYLEAAAQLGDRFPALRHVFVGHGLDTGRVLERMHELHLEDRVQVLGYRDDVAELISASDVLVLPSAHEGFGRCIVEALVAGVPVVATDCDGPRRILDGGQFGVLVGMEPQDLAAGITTVLEDPGLRAELRRLGPIRAQSFDEIAIAYRVNEIYEELLSER